MTEKAKKWSDEAVATLNSIVGTASPVSVELVERAAETLGKSTRSIASKLRQLDREVASMAKEKVAAFTAEEGGALAAFVTDNAGQYTYKEIAENFRDGKFTAKQVQGKLLALELTGSVKPTEKVEVAGKYSEAEEAQEEARCGKGDGEAEHDLDEAAESAGGIAKGKRQSGDDDDDHCHDLRDRAFDRLQDLLKRRFPRHRRSRRMGRAGHQADQEEPACGIQA